VAHGFSTLLRSQIAGAECPRFSISQLAKGLLVALMLCANCERHC